MVMVFLYLVINHISKLPYVSTLYLQTERSPRLKPWEYHNYIRTLELNPIEPSFSVIKNQVRHLQPNTEEQLKFAIEIAVPLMTPKKCKKS